MGQKKIVLIFILLLGLGMRLVNLDQSFWLDEASQAQLSSLSLSQIWSGRGGDFHPPLFYVLAHFWLKLGHSEVWLRLLPVSFGLANICIFYLLAKKLFPDQKFQISNPPAGRAGFKFQIYHLSPFLLAIAPFHIYYSQEFRSYSLLCLLGTLSMYLLYQKKYFWLSVVNALLLYTHYSSVFLILTQFILAPRSIFYFLFSIFVYLPWLPQFFHQLQSGISAEKYLPGWSQVLSIAPLKTLPVIVFKLIAGRIDFLNRYLYGLYIVFVFAVTFTGLILARLHPRFLLLWAFAPIIFMMVVSIVLPQNQPFRVIYVLPAFLLLLAQAALRFPKLTLSLVVYISLVGNIAYFTRPRLQREQWRQASAFLSSQNSPVIVKFPGPFAPLVWYAPNLPVLPALPVLPTLLHSQVYLIQYLTGLTDSELKIDQAIQDQGYHKNRTVNYEGVGFIDEYQK